MKEKQNCFRIVFYKIILTLDTQKQFQSFYIYANYLASGKINKLS